MKFFKAILALVLSLMLLGGCSQNEPPQGDISGEQSNVPSQTVQPKDNSTESTIEPIGSSAAAELQPETDAPILLYMGQASIRIVTPENKVIYIDPYAGEQYDLSADLILVTHAHFDHSMIEKVSERADDCRIITHKEAIQGGEHQVFELEYVTVEAVEAGYNRLHSVMECVGYVLTFTNGKSVYVTGDTSKTEQMPLLAKKQIDYAFFCCDGVYNMDLTEAAECAGLVGAKHNIPYHMTTTTTGRHFDREIAEQFAAENRLIVEDEEEIFIR